MVVSNFILWVLASLLFGVMVVSLTAPCRILYHYSLYIDT